MATDVRQSMAYRVKAKKADDLDKLIKSFAEDKSRSRDPVVEKVANKYLQSVRPNY
jgi:hypothetical protein